MSFTNVTKPDQGDTTKKTLIDTIIDNCADLNARISAASTVLNGSFETDSDSSGIPDSWTRTLFTGGTFLLDDTDQQDGLYSVKFTSPGGVGNGGGRIESTDAFPVSPNRPLRVLWEMKSSVAGVSNVVEVYWFKSDLTASATPSTTLYTNAVTNPTSWTGMSGIATPPSDARFAKIRLTGANNTDATAGSTWFDNVRMNLLTVPTMEVLTASGNWTCPVGVHYVEVEAWGGGGSGGSHTSGVNGGGGGGEYATGRYAVTPGTIYAYTIGAGGVSVSGAGAAGNAGGNTSFGSLIAANGGAGGVTGSGAGGSGTGGTGGAGGTFVITGQSANSTNTAPFSGGDSPRGGGGGHGGNAGAIPGGGGGAQTGGSASGAGGNGRIVLRY